jgi:5-methylcytosine-specific restriction endonuclease McrA
MAESRFLKRTRGIYHAHQRRVPCDEEPGYSLEELRTLVRTTLENRVPCPYCGRRLTLRSLSVDHREPVSRAGGNGLGNLVVCCAGCNQSKGMMNDAEFLALLDLLGDWPEEVRRDTLARLRAGGRMYRR